MLSNILIQKVEVTHRVMKNLLLTSWNFYISCLFYRDLCVILLNYRSSRPEVFLRKGVLKICSKFTGEHPCRRVIFKANLLHIFRAPSPRKTSGRLLLKTVIPWFKDAACKYLTGFLYYIFIYLKVWGTLKIFAT